MNKTNFIAPTIFIKKLHLVSSCLYSHEICKCITFTKAQTVIAISIPRSRKPALAFKPLKKLVRVAHNKTGYAISSSKIKGLQCRWLKCSI